MHPFLGLRFRVTFTCAQGKTELFPIKHLILTYDIGRQKFMEAARNQGPLPP